MATQLNPSPPNPQPQIPPSDTPLTGPTSKRHRRPSVRLGDIGDPSPTLRTSKPWRLNPKSSKSRPLTNLVVSNGSHSSGNKFPKDFTKPRPSTHPSKKVPTSNPCIHAQDHSDDAIHKDNDLDFHDYGEGFKDFDPEGSDNDNDHDSADDMALLDTWHGHNRRSNRVFPSVTTTRVSDSRADMGFDSFPESDSRNIGGSGTGLDEGVRNWLVGLGLVRFAPFFEIHEVDEEVLPHLTLDDLKDMGINAVGTRRKLYFAIQKLGKSALS